MPASRSAVRTKYLPLALVALKNELAFTYRRSGFAAISTALVSVVGRDSPFAESRARAAAKSDRLENEISHDDHQGRIFSCTCFPHRAGEIAPSIIARSDAFLESVVSKFACIPSFVEALESHRADALANAPQEILPPFGNA